MVKKVIESFPILSDNRGLINLDFSRFSQSFADILKKHLPTAGKVHFLKTIDQLGSHIEDGKALEELSNLFVRVKKGQLPVGIHPGGLMLPFAIRGGELVVAFVNGADPVFLSKVNEGWLRDVRGTVEREFLLLKEARVDVQTGLLNLSNLYSLLDTYSSTNGFHLVLVELPPRRSSFQYVLRHCQKCATALMNFLQCDTAIHYLGQCTFAIVLQNNQAEGKRDMEATLVAYMKREGVQKIHIGSSCSPMHTSVGKTTMGGRQLLDAAWTALRHAAKRGPFSFCDYSLLAYPEAHPLRHPERKLTNRLSRLWHRADAFCLVHFHSKSEMHSAKDLLSDTLDRGKAVYSAGDILVYLEGANVAETLLWANERIQLVADETFKKQLSAGISCYPYADFKKNEVVLNCQKALIHAAFLGEPSVAAFDSVSMNISGDIYFGDGDLAKAVLEYRRGLKCDELNVNLHNSLGVALAMSGKLSAAMQSFERALELDCHNFMALCNLGLSEQARGHKKEAFSYFERALKCYREEDDGRDIVDDLHLQLGILAGDLTRYTESLEYLVPWYQRNEGNQRADRVLYYLGSAYQGAGDNRKAMIALQKALQFSEFDDRAMNLLGMVYHKEGEGDDIALSLCRKSVELEPSNLVYRLSLAEIQLHCQLVSEARENSYRCLRSKKHKAQAQLLLGKISNLEGKRKKAREWFQKVLANDPGLEHLRVDALECLQKIDADLA